ncbi:unnamed protein product [Heligmosomoides polygyrus]|uniref:Zf-CHCC domain-containing protein n=1 Tax=Heligmosomoides polygyrus TaxID=6339 RepID=A0A183FFU5_HELPZ|nr:unnamed protein product [Heligmosomoides polygyrus]
MNRALQSLRPRLACVRFSSGITKTTPADITKENAKFDEVTHTGQVNPNIAMNLIAERPAQDCGAERIVFCDGGHPALGHPRVYINLDKPGVHACGYCGNRFYNSHVTKGEDLKIEHLNC